MKNFKHLLFTLQFFFLNCGGNLPPAITSLTADIQTISKGTEVLLICVASDEEDETLTYTWDCTLGTIESDEDSARWIAPDQTGVFSISCEVTDSDHGSDIETIDLIVL